MALKRGDNVRLLVDKGNDAYPQGGATIDWEGKDIIIPAIFPKGTVCKVEHILENEDIFSAIVHNNEDPLDSTIGVVSPSKYEIVKE